MATNLQLDDALVAQAMKLGQHRTKREAVNEALSAYVSALQQERVLELFGQVDFDPSYDYKAERARA
jgi:Arc/MetJ family transcription regulator